MNCKDMNRKLKKLSKWCFILAIAIFAFTFMLFHHTLEDGTFSFEWREEPGKPFVTMLFGIWGVCFLFSSVLSLLIARIFFSDK